MSYTKHLEDDLKRIYEEHLYYTQTGGHGAVRTVFERAQTDCTVMPAAAPLNTDAIARKNASLARQKAARRCRHEL